MPNVRLQDRLDAEVFALDMAGLRGLANSVFHAAHNGVPVHWPSAHILDDPRGLQRSEYIVSLANPQPPWPHDTAADLLAAWRAA